MTTSMVYGPNYTSEYGPQSYQVVSNRSGLHYMTGCHTHLSLHKMKEK